jgi:hypothetical protein
MEKVKKRSLYSGLKLNDDYEGLVTRSLKEKNREGLSRLHLDGTNNIKLTTNRASLS